MTSYGSGQIHQGSGPSDPSKSTPGLNSLALTRFLHGNQAMLALETATVPLRGASVFLANRGAARYQVHALPARFAAIAQLVEHVIRNDGVGGSNPSCGTTAQRSLQQRIKDLIWIGGDR